MTNRIVTPADRFVGIYGDSAVQLHSVAISAGTPISGTSSITFDPSGQLLAQGELAGATSVTLTPATVVNGVTSLSGSTSVSLTNTGNIVTTGGPLSGSAGMIFSPVGRVFGTASISGSAGVAFTATGSTGTPSALASYIPQAGLYVYRQQVQAVSLDVSSYAAQFVLVGTSDFGFSATATLSGAVEGSINGASTITFTRVEGDITAKGRLVGLSDLTFAPTATVTNAAAEEIAGSSSLTFTHTADLDGIAQAVGTTSVTFAGVGRLTSGAISGSSSITLGTSGFALDRQRGTATISLGVSGDIQGLSDTLSANVVAVDFTVNATARGIAEAAGSTSISFGAVANNNIIGIGRKPGVSKSGTRSVSSSSTQRSVVNG